MLFSLSSYTRGSRPKKLPRGLEGVACVNVLSAYVYQTDRRVCCYINPRRLFFPSTEPRRPADPWGIRRRSQTRPLHPPGTLYERRECAALWWWRWAGHAIKRVAFDAFGPICIQHLSMFTLWACINEHLSTVTL